MTDHLQDHELDQELRKTIEEGMNATFVEFPSTRRPLPEHIDLDKFGTNKGIAEATIFSLEHFINSPLIVDQFTDHEERRIARTELTKRIEARFGKEIRGHFNEIMTNNKLKINAIAPIYTSVDFYNEVVVSSQTAEKIINLVDAEVVAPMPTTPDFTHKVISRANKWDTKTLDEKKEVLAQLTDLSVDMLWEIANYQSSNSSPEKSG